MKHLLLVMAGGGVGAGCRYGMTLLTTRLFGLGFPWGTAICNVVGSLVMGLLVGALAQGYFGDGRQANDARLLLGVGMLGGFTTFSTFSLDVIALWERGDTAEAAAYVLGSCAIGFAGLVVGLRVMRGLA